MRVVLDTSVLVALLAPNDTWRAQAGLMVARMRERAVSVLYFDCVVTEAISTVVRRLHERRSVDYVSSTLAQIRHEVPPELMTWILPDIARLYDSVIALIEESNGTLNFNDALIAIACRERGIKHIASFDSDFDQVTWLKRLATPEQIGE